MTKYRVRVSRTRYEDFDIEAESPEDAIQEAEGALMEGCEGENIQWMFSDVEKVIPLCEGCGGEPDEFKIFPCCEKNGEYGEHPCGDLFVENR